MHACGMKWSKDQAAAIVSRETLLPLQALNISLDISGLQMLEGTPDADFYVLMMQTEQRCNAPPGLRA